MHSGYPWPALLAIQEYLPGMRFARYIQNVYNPPPKELDLPVSEEKLHNVGLEFLGEGRKLADLFDFSIGVGQAQSSAPTMLKKFCFINFYRMLK